MPKPRSSVVCVWAASTIIANGCHPQGVPRSVPTHPPVIAVASGGAHVGRPWVDLAPNATAGSIAIDVGDARPLQTSATATPLSTRETDALLARLEPLPGDGAAVPIVRPPSAPPP